MAARLHQRARVRGAALPHAALRDAAVGDHRHALLWHRHQRLGQQARRGTARARIQRFPGRARLRRYLPGDHGNRRRGADPDRHGRIPHSEPLPRRRDRGGGDRTRAHHRRVTLDGRNRTIRPARSRDPGPPQHGAAGVSHAQARGGRDQRQYRASSAAAS